MSHGSCDDGTEDLSRESKRLKATQATPSVWVKVRGASRAQVYRYSEFDWTVSDLLRQVKAEEAIGVAISQLRLFRNESEINDPSKA